MVTMHAYKPPQLAVINQEPIAGAAEARAHLVGRAKLLSWVGLAVASIILMPALGRAKQRIGASLGSAATSGEGTQNMLCAYLAAGVLAGLLGNAVLGLWWLDPVVALGIAGVAVREGRDTWA